MAHDPDTWTKNKNPPLYKTNPNVGYRSLPSKVERLVPKTLPSSAPAPTSPARNWQLTTAERKRILVTHLYGVDIDAQAVEVTKLSLLLKVLEGEARELRGKQLDFHRVLPDLGHNIKCGNRLIGSDFYAQPELPAFDDEARLKLNAFDWPHEFKPIMARGGFDAVIGNPPYIPLELLSDPERNYIRDRYPSLQRKFDSSVAFVLAFLPKLGRSGRLAYIAPQTWETGENYSDFRRVVLEQFGLSEVINLPFNVFKDAYVDTGIFVFTKEKQQAYSLSVMPKKQAIVDFKNVKFEVVATTDLEADLAVAKTPAAQTHFTRDIAATDRAIDQLVYQLYGLTAEEIALVEAATAPAVASTAPTTELAP